MFNGPREKSSRRFAFRLPDKMRWDARKFKEDAREAFTASSKRAFQSTPVSNRFVWRGPSPPQAAKPLAVS